MNLRNIDLNLLSVLDALLDEAHVSRAAQRLNMSQPAVSNALQRCRDLFHDPLLERGRGTMRRTPRAETLREPLKSILSDVVGLIDPPQIDLKDQKQIIRITTSDDPVSILAGPLTTALHDTAPGITIVFQPWRGAAASLQELRDGDADLAISVFQGTTEEITKKTLIEEDYVIAMRHNHPAVHHFDLDAWLAWPHVIVSGQGSLTSPLDATLQSIGRARKVGVVVPSFQMIPRVLAGSDFMAMVPRHSRALHDQTHITCMEPPLKISGFPLHLAWHQRRADDLALFHVIRLIAAVFDDLSGSLTTSE